MTLGDRGGANPVEDDDGAPRAPDPDAERVAAAQRGDRGAFDALVAKYEAPIHGLVRRYVKREADADDVAQRAFLRAFEHIGTFRGASAFRTWLHRIAVHEALGQIRVRDRTEPAELDDLPAFTHSLTTGKLVAKELWQKVERRLAELPPKQRLVLELRVFHDLAFREIAAVADCSEDSAKANFQHAVKRLRDVIAA